VICLFDFIGKVDGTQFVLASAASAISQSNATTQPMNVQPRNKLSIPIAARLR
jgi:hypothetical protein